MKTFAILLTGTILGVGLTVGAAAHYNPRITQVYLSQLQAQIEDWADQKELDARGGFNSREGDFGDVPMLAAAVPSAKSIPQAEYMQEAALPAPRQAEGSPFADTPLPMPAGASCDLPAPGEGSRTIALGTYQARDVTADVSLPGGANASATWSIEASIEQGDQPLWLVLSAMEPVIWNFTGDTDRVERVVIIDAQSGAGTEGVPADRVSVMSKSCFDVHGPIYFSKVASAWQVLGTVEGAIGREVDDIFAQYDLDVVSLPSGEMSVTGHQDPFGPRLNLRYVDPSHLVVSRKAERPEILAGDAGLRQLIDRGILKKDSGYDEYTILRHVDALPPGAGGTFTLEKGVEPPRQTKGRFCIKDWRGKPLDEGSSPFCR